MQPKSTEYLELMILIPEIIKEDTFNLQLADKSY